MSERILISGNEAAAWAARLAKPEFIPTFPITPQTLVIETLEQWKSDGLLPNTRVHQYESEHSVLSATVGGAAVGGRTFTATSSQGLLLMHEIMYIASGNRLPIVMVNVSRGVSAPITLWSDHNDFLGCRDTGWIMLHAKNNQEILDFTLMAFKIAEHPDVRLPVLVNMEGQFIKSYNIPCGGPVLLLPNGNVITIINNSISECSPDGEQVWALLMPEGVTAHHDFHIYDNGDILVAGYKALDRPEIAPKTLRDDNIILFSADGRIKWEWQLADHFNELGLTDVMKKSIWEIRGGLR